LEDKERQEAVNVIKQQKNKTISTDNESQTVKQSGIQKNVRLKFSYNEQREFETIDEDIATLEKRIEALEFQISEEASNYDLLQNLLLKKHAIDEELSAKIDRWVYLNDLADKMKDK